MLDIGSMYEIILLEPASLEGNVGALVDSFAPLMLRFWTNNEVFWGTHFRIIKEIKNKFDAEGIEIPFQ